MSTYSCKPGAEPGAFIITIDFDEPLFFGGKSQTGIRGFYRSPLCWPDGSANHDSPRSLLAAIDDLEHFALNEALHSEIMNP